MTEANAVVVLFAGALGDLLLALPALRLLRRRYRAQRLVLGVRAPLLELARRAACADAVAALDDPSVAVLLGGGAPPPWWPERPALYSWFGADDADVRHRLTEQARDARFLRVERGAGTLHAAAAYAAAVGESLTWQELVPLGRLSHADVVAHGPPQLVLHRGAGAATKRWDAKQFTEVAGWWHRRGGRVVDVLGPAEQALAVLPEARVLRDAPLVEVLDALAGAAAYVGNDSGVSHVAGALGTTGVVLFGPTDPARWRPLSADLEVLRAPADAWSADGFRLPPAQDVVRSLERAALP